MHHIWTNILVELVDLITKIFKYLILMIFGKKVDHVQLTANKKLAKLGLISILPNCSFLSIMSKKNRLIDLLISLTYDIYNHLVYTLLFFSYTVTHGLKRPINK